jgi:two-component system chemotaxis sensor kinase CheA
VPEQEATPVLLFRDCSGARRAIRLGIVDRIEEVKGSAVTHAAGCLRVQLGEAILPLAGLTQAPEPSAKVRLFRLSDGVTQLGLAFSEVIDLDGIAEEIIPSGRPGEVEGVTLVAGEPAELVDAHWLFAQHAGQRSPTGQAPICRIDLDDPWTCNMLRPIVEAAGYRVVGLAAEEKADLMIAPAAQASPQRQPSDSRTLWLSPYPDAPANENHIYRYDRAGLLVALREAAKPGAAQ